MDKYWLFIPGSDACGICQAMEGRYEVRPGQPHKNCRCQIVEVKDSGWLCRHDGDRVIRNRIDGTIHVTQDISVICCCEAGGEEISESVELEITSDDGWAELSSLLEEVYENL